MRLYADTSVIVALILRERGWDRTTTWLSDNADELLWSTFGWGEFIDAVARRVRRKDFSDPGGQNALEVGRAYLSRWQAMTMLDEDVVWAAASLAANLERALKLPDAIHIAIARRVGATLVTHDRAQSAAAHALGVATVNPLEEPA